MNHRNILEIHDISVYFSPLWFFDAITGSCNLIWDLEKFTVSSLQKGRGYSGLYEDLLDCPA